ncbi:hypothetical protein CK203_048666 [Vitis vinifera]|uniref:Uncharacterized protein n=1 Tax=Vitis vinifera TaxID=29760 RepID=A0A438GWJ0_VITVI|nr:hypothetical protein CK203_048666 [Vitis vinifera]
MVAHSNAEQEEETWFADNGANQHITANLEHLTLQQPYTRQENVAVVMAKDIQTGVTLLEGRSEGGLYPIQLRSMSINKSHALSAVVGIKAFQFGILD